MSDQETNHQGITRREINKKVTALLALEAKMIEKSPELYNLKDYIPELFSQIEALLEIDRPERLLDPAELKTFKDLIFSYTGGERRKGIERRRNDQKPSSTNRRDGEEERRWDGHSTQDTAAEALSQPASTNP